MNAIRVNKVTLLEKLRENRAKHRQQFDEAAEGYREKAIEVLTERLDEARKGKLPAMVFHMPMPINQTAQYDRAIGMLEMSLDTEIDLEEHDFQQYVQDEWGWSAATTATNSAYLKK